MRHRLGALAGAFATLLSMFVAITVAPAAPASAASAKVFLLGDSVMEGLTFSSAALATLNNAYEVTLDAKVCRALLEPSCYTKYDGRPPAALTVLQANRGHLGQVVVIMVGYNDSGIGPKIDAIMGELESQHVPHVLWLTYRNTTGRYSASNAALYAAAAVHSTLRIADWSGYSAGHGSWFAGDGLHLTGAGADALAAFLKTNIGTVLGLAAPPPPRCAGPTRGTAVAAPAATPPRSGAPSGFLTTTPVRAIDTRTGAPVGKGRSLDVNLSGTIPTGATAAFVNVTAVSPCAAGFLTAYPCDGAVPLASNVDYVAGRTVANQAAPLLAANRHVCVYTSATTDVLVDVFGWFAPGKGWRYEPITPVRLVDTRNAYRATNKTVGAIKAGGTLAISLAPMPGPHGGPLGALVNVTAVGATGPGYLTVSACGVTPNVSTLDYDRGEIVANLAAASIVGNGAICVHSNAVTDVVVDLEGWFSLYGSLYSAQTPQRVVDTRKGQGGTTLANGGAVTIKTPAGATAVAANVTVVGPAAAGFLTAYPCGPAPWVSNVDYGAGAVVPGLAAVATARGAYCVLSSSRADVVVDVEGHFT